MKAAPCTRRTWRSCLTSLPRFNPPSACTLRQFQSARHLEKPQSSFKHAPKLLGAGCAALGAGILWYRHAGDIRPVLVAEAESRAPDAKGSGKRLISLAEVHRHGSDAEKCWVVKGSKVYDITDWIPNHPGGEVILRAVGGVIDPYWDIFSIHKKPEVYDILDQYYIGDVDPRDLIDGRVPQKDVDNPFKRDPERDPSLVVHAERPFNAETPLERLDSFITPNRFFYVRNHLWAPPLSEAEFQLTVEMPDGEEKSYSLSDLKKRFKQVEITAVLQCSGNRRKNMSERARNTEGLQWDVGGLSNASWVGVRLRDLLADAGFDEKMQDKESSDEVKHLQFQGAEAYGASIPIEKAMDRRGDVLLAHTMNGQPLPVDHGFPLRVVVPGHVAARSVKWLRRITLSPTESQSQWQQNDYKCFGPNEGGSASVDWSKAPAIQEFPVQSAIVAVRSLSSTSKDSASATGKNIDGDNKGTRSKNASEGINRNKDLLRVYGLEEDAVELEGYAISGGGRRIVRVDVSADDGQSWTQARLLDTPAKGYRAWSWTRWQIAIPKRLTGRQFVVKAVDEANNTQPEAYEPFYNFKGNLTNSWHKVSASKVISGKS